MTVKDRFSKAVEQTKKATSSVGEKLSQAGKIAKDSAKTIAISILDQDGDGQIGQNDFKIMTEKGVDVGKKTIQEVKVIAKEASETELVKDAAAGAMIGAVIAVPVPIIGPVAGAAVGAAVGTYAHITKGCSNTKTKTTKENNAVKKSIGSVSKVKTTVTKLKRTTTRGRTNTE